jgi:transposase-like protein
MSSKKETVVMEKKKRTRTPSPVYSAAEKAQAVLAVWTERVKTAQVLKTMNINYICLQQWQDRAMEGMLQALETRVNLSDGAALSPRLKALLQKRQQLAGREKLRGRLEQLQEIASQAPVPSDP